jgi:glycosyltransferase involved in cell wall biosynthesis
MPRLLFIVNVDWFFLSHRLPVALAARDAGFEVHVATALTGPASVITSHGFMLHPINLDRRSANPINALRLVWALWRLMRALRPSIVHLVTIKPVLLGGVAARLARVPRVVAAISGLGFVFTALGAAATVRKWLVASLYRIALVRPGVKVIFQNSDDQSLLQSHAGVSDTQVVRIRGSGVDLASWAVQPLPLGPPVVLMASRLLVDKGVNEFIEAARRLRGHADARFILVGDVDPGNPTSLERAQVLRCAEDGVIEWWGHRSDMQQVLAAAHVVVLPSYREGLPKVLIEAAASGRAVVTTDVPGCRDAIVNGSTGLLAAPRDPEALAAAIRALLDAPENILAFGRAGRQLAEEAFDVREVVANHLRLYQESVTPT